MLLAANLLSSALTILPCGTAGWVDASRSLVITDLSVVNDARARKTGAWSFARAMAAVLPAAGVGLGAATEAWLDQFGSVESLNGFKLAPRTPGPLLDNWSRSGGELVMSRAPLRLLAVVYRADVAEGRLLFGATDVEAGKKNLTVAFEFGLPGEAATWGPKFAALSLLPFGPAFNNELENLTNAILSEGHINQVRTNEQFFGQGWDLREFKPNAAGSRLIQVPVAQTPDIALAGPDGGDLVAWLAANGDAVKSGKFQIPRQYLGASAFLEDDQFQWLKGVDGLDEGVRAAFARNTCNGCHGPETETRFVHIAPRVGLETAKLSPFLLSEMTTRRVALEKAVCAL